MNLRHGLVAQAALGDVDDAFERQRVVRREDHPKISQRVPDLRPFVKSESADDFVRQTDGDEPVLELAGLKLGPNQDRAAIEPAASALDQLQFLADPPGFL